MANPPVRPPDSRIAEAVRTVRVVAVTDRRLMVPADVLAACDWRATAAAFGAAVERAVRGCPTGSVIVQIREKDLDGGPLLRLVRAAQPFAPIIVNDRVDVALAAGAFGVHLPERGISVDDARRLAPGLAIGVSRHGDSLGGLDATGADLIHLGPIWPTPSKPTVVALGEPALRAARSAVRDAILVAVGGIDSAERAHEAAAAGASAAALIRLAWAGPSLAAIVTAVEAAFCHR